MTIKKRFKVKSQESQKDDLLERYSPLKIGKILPTTIDKKPIVFNQLRPKPGECLDYKISETFVKLDVGDTKINVKQTEARYVPVPPDAAKPLKKKKVLHSHGGPPQWKFVDEIWRDHQDELQIRWKREFADFFVRTRRKNKIETYLIHSYTQSMLGPAWYQELSPKQIDSVDQLKLRIAQDLKENTIVRTEETLSRLGIVPKPNSKHIDLALKLCCGIDSEFLLILYQLINPKRKVYSINDRLLLSAVVHLTMTETLRELHVRIPSPPRKKESVPSTHEKRVRKTFKSPYLVPFTFKPNPPKYSGVYKNKHIQYPQSIYFSYIDALHQEMKFAENILAVDSAEITDPGDLDLLEDMKNAQKLYNKLCNNTSIINLMTPTIKNVCRDYQNYSKHHGSKADEEFEKQHLAELDNSGEKCTCLQPPEDLDDDCCEFDFFEECECEEKCCCKEKSKLFMKSMCKRCIAARQHKNARNIIIGTKMTESNTLVPIIGGTFVEKDCDCMLKYEEKLLGVAARNRIKCQKAKYVIGGVASTHLGPIYLISSVTIKNIPEKPEELSMSESSECNKMNKKSEITEDDEVTKSNPSEPKEEEDCQCKKELDSFLQHKCTCEQCKVAQEKKNTTYILQGLRKMNDEAPVNIIGGVYDQRCDCLSAYLDRMKKMEEYKSRLDARCRMKSQNHKFAISGVVVTPQGPVYCIGGVRSPVQCVCAEVARQREEDEKNLKRMAKMPPTGRIKYEISGVKHGSQENTFIISKALPVEECPCEKLYTAFQEAHGTCLNAFEEYLRRIEEEMDEYNEEYEEEDVNNMDQALSKPLMEEEAVVEEPTPVKHERPQTKTTTTGVATEISEVSGTVSEHGDEDNDVTVNARPQYHETPQKSNDYATPCILEPEPVTKRFVILNKIPCSRQKQLAILKKVLSSMADDGFPLAKLPECHKLSHFKLWMEMRCGKSWSLQDRECYENFSKYAWQHTGKCYFDVPSPKLGISKSLAETITWRDATFYRKLIQRKKYLFHRKIKQQIIHGAKEFFPLTFSYEFPTPTFRDCYFAYMPGKEEDVIVG